MLRACHGDTVSISDGLTEISVHRDDTWTLKQTPIQGIHTSAYRGRSIAGAIQAGHLYQEAPTIALAALLRAGDYSHIPWWRIVDDLSDIEVYADRDGCHACMPGTDRSVSVARRDHGWSMCDADDLTYRWVSDSEGLAAEIIAYLTQDYAV